MIEIRQVLFTKNPRYKDGKRIVPKGIMVHSTGANNPNLRRYVQPDDGLLGGNIYGTDWNRETQSLCVHAFIGKDKDGKVRCYQVLPWDYRTYHCGYGPNGSGNSTHISFEICEDGLEDREYFEAVYDMAAELCAYLCEEFGLKENDVICHSEGHEIGIASNHGDVMHWFPKFGKDMDEFRREVGRKIKANKKTDDSQKTADEFEKQIAEYLEKQALKDPSNWSEEARSWAESAGVITGDENGNKQYGRFATREEIVQMLYNAIGKG